MKPNQLILLSLFVFLSFSLYAQNEPVIRLRTGIVQAPLNIKKAALDSFNARTARDHQKSFAILQFESLPDQATRSLLSAGGVQLLEYIPDNAFTVTITGSVSMSVLQQSKARSLIRLAPEQKMEPGLALGMIPSYAIKTTGTVDVWISFPKTFSAGEVISELRNLNMDILSTQYQWNRILSLRISSGRLKELASLPFIEYVQPAPGADQPLNFNSRSGSRANMLNASGANGGKGLNGEGVVVGIGDDADVQSHIDFAGRLIDRAAAPVNGTHGHHTTGTLAGAGNGNERYRGYAPKATIVSQYFSGILMDAPVYVSDYGMVVTNNSYGDIIDCSYFGTYDLYSRLLDQMAFDMPHLTNVFAAGNSGGSTCLPFSPGFHTVLGGYQSAKNVVTVGATTDSGLVAAFSSKGPVRDGRIKPEITAMGQMVASAWPTNIYSFSSGTSMASPAVSGGLALLYQRYRQLNGGANPTNALMKALLCNGASDRGTIGPDFQYGFGWMNLLRSVDMMEAHHYITGSSTNGSINTYTVSVPANTAALKVMLYWNDPAASPLSAKSLVNDLDLEVTDASSATVLPGVLDTTNAGPASTAAAGADHTNNMEQVIIDHPASGSYTIKVKGTAITQGSPQDYVVAYDPVPVQLMITSPAGGEAVIPTTTQYDFLRISWDAFGYATGTVTLEFSPDGGASWSTIASGLDINRDVYTWLVPGVATGNALIRITKEGSGESSTSHPFTIVAAPTVSLAATQCEGYINLNWGAIAGATDYEVMMLRADSMQSVATTTATSYALSGLSKDSVYWVTVRARVNGQPGRRAAAISRQPNSGSCSGNISDGDLKIDAILAPVSGRKFTSSQLSAASPVTIRIKNLDDAPVTGFDLGYSINGGAFVTEPVASTIAAGGTYTYTFTATADLSAPGSYQLRAVVKNLAPDAVTANDTTVVLIRHADNQPLDLSSGFLDDMESALPATYQRDTIALNGLERYDFSRSTIYGRLRTFVNSGLAYSGTKAITLDANRYYIPGNTSYLTGTFNLSNYNVNSNEVRLDFEFNNHGQQPNANNKVWVRGNDTQPWIEAYDLDDNQEDPGIYKRSPSLEVSDLLAANGQVFSPSFQVRWGQWGQIAAVDKENAAGYTFDNIRVYEVFNDMQMLSIDAPVHTSCGLTNATTVKVSIRNSANTSISSVPVRYRINNGGWVSETIPSVAANTTVSYSFATTADLSGLATYTLQAIVDLPADSYRENDTATATVVNSPVITTFPYLQNFEKGDGYWYSGGKNASWQYGTPSSTQIHSAASGAKAWKTRLQGNYNDLEHSYLYSPCFDLSGMANPTLSFSVALDLEDCGAQLCDGAWVEYSTDGQVWNRLGSTGEGTNWYNTATQLWSIEDDTRWHVATIPLPAGTGQMRFRFVLSSDPAVNREGIAIDDVHIYDKTHGIYDSTTMVSPVSQAVSGNSWIHFTSGGKLIASILPGNQDLGSTDVQAYRNAGPVRYTTTQYYLDRNITIKPATAPQDSVTVRLYFLDSEADSLILASGCATCSKPSSAYELGVSKYSDPDRNFENGSIHDDQQGIWQFIPSGQVAIVPFDKGYYAEFRVRDFSEFWLNNGAIDKSSALPVKLLGFTAIKESNDDVLIRWSTGSEDNVDRYEVELARNNAELQAGHFVKIGEVAGAGNTTSARTYTFTDTEADKFGPRYYRLKITNADGSFSYSPIRSVVFDEPVLWQVYPNPSHGLFALVYQLNNNEQMSARVIDASGRLVRQYFRTASGFLQKLSVDLTPLPSGVYLLQMEGGGKKETFKLYKQ